MDRAWTDGAACRGLGNIVAGSGPDFFFDRVLAEDREDASELRRLRALMCFDCPVKLSCRLEGYAEVEGYWGNTSARYRRDTRRHFLGRLFPEAFRRHASAEDVEGSAPDYTRLRQYVTSVSDSCNIRATLLADGFTPSEVAVFEAPSPWDRQAERAVARQERQRARVA